jgi:site-specific recombinase XerD
MLQSTSTIPAMLSGGQLLAEFAEFLAQRGKLMGDNLQIIFPDGSDHDLMEFDERKTQDIVRLLYEKHDQLAQRQLPTEKRPMTARNYDTSIQELFDFMERHGARLPSKGLLARWRDDMLHGQELVPPTDRRGYRRKGAGGQYSISAINSRLSAVRKLLREVADDVTDIEVKLALRDWAAVKDAKPINMQDKTEEDYGRRLTLESFKNLVNSTPHNLKGLRDRALLAVCGGAGLRISEAVRLNMNDVFTTQNESGQRGIKIRDGKHGKQRVVVLNSWNSWVIKAVQAYTDALGLTVLEHANERVFRGLKRMPKPDGSSKDFRTYVSQGIKLSKRNAQTAIESYLAEYQGEMTHINAHDLRRTYAKISRLSGMSWDALRANMGHSSVLVTERYVGHDIDWAERMPNWTIELEW